MRTRKEVNADSVSTEFNKFLESSSYLPIEQIAMDTRKAGQVYQDLIPS